MIAGSLVAIALALDLVTPSSGPPQDVVTKIEDPAIVEASALVVDDGLFLTTNDSGDTGRVFAVDRSGATVGVTHWSDDPVDTEALAPAGPGYVWVGDIGDNNASRTSVDIARIPVGRGDRTVQPTIYRLSYPDKPVNAETMVRNPQTGRLYIATKATTGGTLYAVPKDLSSSTVSSLEPVGPVLPIATDGSFFPDGRHLILRNYTEAVVYDWPSMKSLGSFTLPHQRQGEGLGIAEDGSVYLSSEGPDQPILQVHLPESIARQVEPTGSPSLISRIWHHGWPWLLLVLIALLGAAAWVGQGRARRRSGSSGA